MIQRIQSIYMLLASVAMLAMFFFSLAEFVGGTESFSLKLFGVYSTQQAQQMVAPTTYMGVLAVLATILPFITIFAYKRRMLQIRMCYVALVLTFGVMIFVGYYTYRAHISIANFKLSAISYSVVDLMPIVAILFLWLAIKSIIKDEAMVRSLDRLR